MKNLQIVCSEKIELVTNYYGKPALKNSIDATEKIVLIDGEIVYKEWKNRHRPMVIKM